VAYVLGNAVGGFETGTKWFYSMGGGTAGGAPVLLGRAGGGPVAAGTPYMVGERGPEMFVPRSSGTILPNSAGGGVNVYVNYQPSVSLADKAEVENKLAPIIKQALRGMATR
jgi:phage-related minor tail protein